jgi:hypothetical protein
LRKRLNGQVVDEAVKRCLAGQDGVQPHRRCGRSSSCCGAARTWCHFHRKCEASGAKASPGNRAKGPKTQDSAAGGEVVGIRSLTPTCVAAGEQVPVTRAWPKPSP